jgi:hypothetical protein
MKKIYIMMVLVLTGAMAVAQTSVWHGGRAIWTRGAGTEGNPILIESADNLAYLAYVVNKGYDTKDLYFKLTTDVDLNGSEDLQWVPIGLGDRWFSEDGCERGRPSGVGFFPHTSFLGHFDGGEHSISNIYIDNSERQYGDYAGLFGCAEGIREGEEIYPAVIENVFVTSGYLKGVNCGGIVGNANRATLVSRCWNGATIEGIVGEMITCCLGGIVGQNAYQVKNCYNVGDVSGYYAGGIVGFGNSGTVEIEECYNEGNIIGTYAGGIFGFSRQTKVVINNCYNLGNIDADGSALSSSPAGPTAAGIASFIWRGRDGSITNCYNVGAISSTREAGCIMAYSTDITLENNHYINTCDAGGEGTPQAEDVMQSQAFVDLLNGQNEVHVWALDANHTNGGFPILTTIDLSIPEITRPSFNVYPNPAQGCLTVEGKGEMTITNILGQTVMRREIDGKGAITLPKGMYFITLNGKTQKIVVK